MDDSKIYTQRFDENEESNFNLMEWLMLFLHYWYLFVIFVGIAIGLAYLKNRTWIENYKSTGTIILEEGRGSSGQLAFMQGFGVQSGFRNIENQVIMLTSYDLISRVVDSIPLLEVDYVSKGNFKTRTLYNATPFIVETEYIDPRAYGVLFKIDLKPDGTYVISDEDGKFDKNLKIEGRLGIPLQHNLFFMTVSRTNNPISSRNLYFRLRSKESLISEFMGRLQSSFVSEGSSILAISLSSQAPNRDIDFINMLSDVFISENLERKNDAASKTIDFIDHQLDTVSKSLSVSEGAMTNFRRSNQIVDLSSHSSKVLGKASQYDDQLSQLQLRETYLNYLSNYLQTNIESGSIVAPSSLGLNEPMLMSLVQQFNEVLTKKSETNEKNPLYARYERDIESLKNSINEVIKNIRASMNIERSDLKGKLANVDREINTLPVKEMQLIGIERKYRVDDNYYSFFLQKKAEAAIQKASNSPDNFVLDRARIVALTNGGAKSKTLSTYVLLGLLIPILFVVLKELFNSTIRDARDIEKSTKYQLIGTVKKTKSKDPILAVTRPKSSFAEIFRVIRTRIEFIVQRKKDIVVMTTSAESGDGKTFFSINLAGTYAMSGQKTLLVDMDIRKPNIHERLNIDKGEGVTDYLLGEYTLDELIITGDERYNFDVLPAGSIPPNPGEFIRSDKLKQLILELKTRYTYIIIDTSPIGLVADAYALSSQVDVTLLLARSNKTNKSNFKSLNNQLISDNLENFYVVLNDVDFDNAVYGKYSKGYGYNYGYGYYGRKREAKQYMHYYDDEVN